MSVLLKKYMLKREWSMEKALSENSARAPLKLKRYLANLKIMALERY